MPALTTDEKTLLRSGPSELEYFLAIMPRTVIFAASLDNSEAAPGLMTLKYDSVTVGAWTDIVVGQTLRAFDSAGTAYKGKVRVTERDATNIYVAANYDIDWEDDDLLYVVNIFEPWSRPTHMVDAGGSIIYYKDTNLSFPGSNAAMFPPKANGGVAYAGFIDESLGYRDVAFWGSQSIPMAPGATITDWAWNIADGTYAVGTATSPDITARFSTPGFKWVFLVVTDSNGRTAGHSIPVWIFGGDYQPLKNFTVKRRTHQIRDGEMVVECFETGLTDTDIPEGTQAVLFSREWINGAEVFDLLGCPFPTRRQVRFTGWILEDTVTWDPERGAVTFTVGTLGKVADNLRGFGTFLKNTSDVAPTGWHEAQDLTVRTAAFFLLEWHTNLNTIAQIEYWGYGADTTLEIAGRNFQTAPPLKQLEATLMYKRGLFAHIGCSRWGSIHLRYDPMELSDSDQNAVATVIDLVKTDLWTEVKLERSTRARLSGVLGGGIYWNSATNTGTPYRARAPGQIGRESGKTEQVDGLIIAGQDHLNDLLGSYLAAASNQWATIPVEAMWDVFEPALQEYITVTIAADDNPRGYSFGPSNRWIVREVDIEDQAGGAPIIKLEAELLLSGAAKYSGVTVEIPEAPDFPNPPPPVPLPDLGPGEMPEEGTVWPDLAWFFTEDSVYESLDFSGTDRSDQPTWDKLTTDGAWDGASHAVEAGGVDPTRPDYYKYAYFDTSGRIVRLDDSPTGSGVWEEILADADVDGTIKDFVVDPVTGYLWAMSQVATGGAITVYKSTDRGDSWDAGYAVDSQSPSVPYYLDVYNDVAVLPNGTRGLNYTLNGNTSWSNFDPDGEDITWAELHPASHANACYYLNYDQEFKKYTFGQGYGVTKVDLGGTGQYLDMVDYHPHLAGDPLDYQYAALLAQDEVNGNYYIWETDDDWSTYTQVEPKINNRAYGWVTSVVNADPELWGGLIYATWFVGIGSDNTPHCIAVADIGQDLIPDGKAGYQCYQSPYADSIPMIEGVATRHMMFFAYSGDIP